MFSIDMKVKGRWRGRKPRASTNIDPFNPGDSAAEQQGLTGTSWSRRGVADFIRTRTTINDFTANNGDWVMSCVGNQE